MTSGGYHVEEVSAAGVRSVGCYGIDEPAAISAARWYSHLMRRAAKCYRVVLVAGLSRVVVYG